MLFKVISPAPYAISETKHECNMRQTLVTESSSVQDKWMSSFDVRTQQEERQKNSQGMTHLKNASQPVFLLISLSFRVTRCCL